jgi:RNA polymerase primary sigma factor
MIKNLGARMIAANDQQGLEVLLAHSRGLPPLEREEERALARRARRGDTTARDQLVRRNLPLVVAFARKQSRGALRLEELVQEGNLGLLRAIEKYDPEAGTRFSTYAVWWIRAYVWRYLKMARWAVRPKSGTAALADFSLDAPLDEDGDHTFVERLEDDAPAPDDRYATKQGATQLGQALAKVRGRIGELGWDIIHTRLQQDPPETLEQIGRRHGVSRERVRQVESATKRFLRGYLQPLEDGREAA